MKILYDTDFFSESVFNVIGNQALSNLGIMNFTTLTKIFHSNENSL